MELWDLYDSRMNPVSVGSRVCGDEVPEGLYHLVCDVLVWHSDGEILLMQRDSKKDWGGLWEATAGGSAVTGETPLECAVRELYEETGLTADSMTEVGCVTHHEHRTIYVEHLAKVSCPKDSVVLQEGETQDYRWVTKEELAKMTRDELITKRMQIFVGKLIYG